MRTATRESEEQRRRRVVSRIRNELQAQVAGDLVEWARVGKFADEWMTVDQVNQALDREGYWVNHPHVLASFLSPAACEEIIANSLEVIVEAYPDAWVCAGEQYKPATRDWNAYAASKANLLRRDFPTAERTALHTGADGASVLFGHDDYLSDPRAREEVTLLRGYLKDAGIPELGFGLSKDGRTWVMVVWSEDEAMLSQALFNAWQTAFGG